MKELDEVLTQMNFDFLGNGKHGMSIEGMRKAIGDDHFLFLDVRTHEEMKHCSFPFATHIPMHELPARLVELPKDKCIITFCSSIFRGAIAYAYLTAKGFSEVKGLTASMEDMIGAFKPGPLLKMQA